MMTKYGAAEPEVSKTAEGRGDVEKVAADMAASRRRAEEKTKPYSNKQKAQVSDVP